MGDDRWQELLDIAEQQERDLGALKADYARLKGASLAHEMFIHAMMTTLAARGLLAADDMTTLISQQIAAVEQSGTSGIGKHAVEHLKLLLNSSFLAAPAEKRTAQ